MKEQGIGKRIALALLLLVVIFAVLLLCFTLLSLPEEQSSEPVRDQQTEQAEQQPDGISSDYYDVVIAGADVTTDSQGGQALIVTFDYTNKTNTAVCFMQAVVPVVFQDGVALGQDAYVTGYTGSDGVTPDYLLKVEPGATATVHVVYALTSNSNVNVVCTLGFVDGGYPDPNALLAEQEFEL